MNLNSLLTRIGSKISNFANSRFGSGILGSILSLITYNTLGLSKAEKEANAFTAQQNQEAMDFEERMANNQMAFQADQAATQWQRGVADMQAAGLNPALAYGQGGAQAMTGSSGAGHAGASVSPATSLSDIIQLATLGPTIQNMKAQARETNARAKAAEIDADWAQLHNQNKFNQAIEEINLLIENGNTLRYERQVLGPLKATLMSAQASAAEGQAKLSSAEAVYHEWRNNFYEQNGFWPGERASSYFWNIMSGLIEGSRSGPGSTLSAAGFRYP